MEDDLRRAIEWALSERDHAADARPGAKGKGGDVTSADGSSEVERLVSEVARCRGKIAAQDETLRTRELELQARSPRRRLWLFSRWLLLSFVVVIAIHSLVTRAIASHEHDAPPT